MPELSELVDKHRQTAATLTANLQSGIPQWIGGVFLAGSAPALPAVDPFTNEAFAQATSANAVEVDLAIAAARKAQPEWAGLPPRKRAKFLHDVAAKLRDKKDELSKAEAINAGLPKMVSGRLSVASMIRSYEYYAEWADKIYGEVVPTNEGNVLDYTLREPHGVVAIVTAWNTPALFLGTKIAPALAAGNTVVIKPSESCPLPGHLLAQAFAEAGLPAGVANIVYGGAETGQALVSHPGIDMVSFTGGTAIGQKIASQAALKPLCLELGGKSPSIVFPDANLTQVTMNTMAGAFALSGQACAASSRLIVHKDIHDELVTRLGQMRSMLPLGDPLHGATVLGPLISKRQLERVQAFFADGQAAGAKLAFGGNVKNDGIYAAGNFFEPTLFTDVPPDSRLAQEEVFGPICSVFKFEKEEEALALANRTDFGLAGAVWTSDIRRAHRFAREIKAGFVWINAYGNLPYTVPFGGYNQSGHGREGGRDGILEFTRTKNVYVQL